MHLNDCARSSLAGICTLSYFTSHILFCRKSNQRKHCVYLKVLVLSWQEIPLSEILCLEPAQTFSPLPDGANPHCFEIATASLVYFVGENLLRAESSVSSSSILVNPMESSIAESSRLKQPAERQETKCATDMVESKIYNTQVYIM